MGKKNTQDARQRSISGMFLAAAAVHPHQFVPRAARRGPTSISAGRGAHVTASEYSADGWCWHSLRAAHKSAGGKSSRRVDLLTRLCEGHVRDQEWLHHFSAPDALFASGAGVCKSLEGRTCGDCLRALSSCKRCINLSYNCSCSCPLTLSHFSQSARARERTTPQGARYSSEQYIFDLCDTAKGSELGPCTKMLPCNVGAKSTRGTHAHGCTTRRLPGWGWNPAVVRLPAWLEAEARAAGFSGAAFLGVARFVLDDQQPFYCPNPGLRNGSQSTRTDRHETTLLLLDDNMAILGKSDLLINTTSCSRLMDAFDGLLDSRLLITSWSGMKEQVVISYWRYTGRVEKQWIRKNGTFDVLVDSRKTFGYAESHWVAQLEISFSPGAMAAVVRPSSKSCFGVRLAAARNAALLVHPASGLLTHELIFTAPHFVWLSREGELTARTVPPSFTQGHHNSINPLWLPEWGVYLGIAHRHKYDRKGSWSRDDVAGGGGFQWGFLYLNILYTLEPVTLQLQRFSSELLFPALDSPAGSPTEHLMGEGIQFVMSALRLRSGSIAITYGVNDCESALLTLTLDELDRQLTFRNTDHGLGTATWLKPMQRMVHANVGLPRVV